MMIDREQCVCGHGKSAHFGHTFVTAAPTHCSQACGCLAYRKDRLLCTHPYPIYYFTASSSLIRRVALARLGE